MTNAPDLHEKWFENFSYEVKWITRNINESVFLQKTPNAQNFSSEIPSYNLSKKINKYLSMFESQWSSRKVNMLKMIF